MALEVQGFAPMVSVFDMPRSLAFYRDVLGFEVVSTSEPRRGDDFGWGLLKLQDIELMLNTAYDHDERPAAPDAARVAVHEDTALFFGCRDLDAAYENLCAHGLELAPPTVAPYGMKQLWLKDPDGYVICLQWPVA
jgi:glyoxylase I family protein